MRITGQGSGDPGSTPSWGISLNILVTWPGRHHLHIGLPGISMRLKQFVNQCFATLLYQLKVALLLWIWLFLDGPSYVTFTGVFFMDQLSGVPPMWPTEKILSRDEMPCSVLLAKEADKTEMTVLLVFFIWKRSSLSSRPHCKTMARPLRLSLHPRPALSQTRTSGWTNQLTQFLVLLNVLASAHLALATSWGSFSLKSNLNITNLYYT